jgi:AcrR family transcriptional regulator
MAKKKSQSDARTRIVQTAENLFYSEGIRSVGIDRIIAEANVAKMTLYNHFSSKDELILAVLEYREEQFSDYISKGIESFMDKGMDKLDAFFAVLEKWIKNKNFRGCSFINATVELADSTHPACRFALKHKKIFHKMIEQIIIDIGAPPSVSPAICMMVEGAIVTAQVEGDMDCVDVIRDATSVLLSNS